jgi:AraC-like DNA-binding protein
MSKDLTERVVIAKLGRPEAGPTFLPHDNSYGLTLSGLPGWQSNGGPHRGHPARSLPQSIEIPVPDEGGILSKIQIVGVFALYASHLNEAAGTMGASIQIAGEQLTEARFDLLNSRHYRDATDLNPLNLRSGDGTSLETIGTVLLGGVETRVDLFSIDLHDAVHPTKIIFRDLGSPASFVLFDVLLGFTDPYGCPFHSHGGGISLADIASIVRLGDRVRLSAALDQLCDSLPKAEDLDEARGQALTFLSMVTAATLEMGGSRSMHRVLLEAARELDQLHTAEKIGERSRQWVEEVAPGIFRDAQTPTSKLVDKALQLVDRNFARDLTDAVVASQLGLSTSHFRFLFKQATGQPFHKYLIAIRLEKARTMLVEQQIGVTAVAEAVGFAGLSHFSRAFAQRFHVSPTAIRKAT